MPTKRQIICSIMTLMALKSFLSQTAANTA